MVGCLNTTHQYLDSIPLHPASLVHNWVNFRHRLCRLLYQAQLTSSSIPLSFSVNQTYIHVSLLAWYAACRGESHTTGLINSTMLENNNSRVCTLAVASNSSSIVWGKHSLHGLVPSRSRDFARQIAQNCSQALNSAMRQVTVLSSQNLLSPNHP